MCAGRNEAREDGGQLSTSPAAPSRHGTGAPHGPEEGPTVSARPLPCSPALGTTTPTAIRGASHVRPVARKPVESPPSSRDGPWENARLVLADGAEIAGKCLRLWDQREPWLCNHSNTGCGPGSAVGFQVTKSAFRRPARQGDAALRRGAGRASRERASSR